MNNIIYLYFRWLSFLVYRHQGGIRMVNKNTHIFFKTSIDESSNKKKRKRLINELGNDLTQAQILYSKLEELIKIRQLKRIEEIKKFINSHKKYVGEIQAIKDLQRGLSILNKNRRNSPIECKNILIEDGIFGDKTNMTLYDTCLNYPVKIIKKYILKAIINNIIFDTKNENTINTECLIKNFTNLVKEY